MADWSGVKCFCPVCLGAWWKTSCISCSGIGVDCSPASALLCSHRTKNTQTVCPSFYWSVYVCVYDYECVCMHVCVCVCVSVFVVCGCVLVCVWEREGERNGGEGGSELDVTFETEDHSEWLCVQHVSKCVHIICVTYACECVHLFHMNVAHFQI